MVSRRLYEVIGLACGFILIDYGFNTLAVGLRGARELTSQFIGINLLLGGSALVFGALYYLLKPVTPQVPLGSTATSTPNVGVELINDKKDTAPKYGFYKEIEYIGYFFTFLGLVSAADLVLQVFIPLLYNEIRFWVEILLVVFGVLSYAIFVSIGQLGAQEEKITKPIMQPSLQTAVPEHVALTAGPQVSTQPYGDVLEVRLVAFSKSETGEYERQLSDKVYDMVRIEQHGVTIWREDRRELRSVYLAGPYELNWMLLEDYVKRGEELRIGSLLLPLETIRNLLGFHAPSAVGISSSAAS